MNAIAFPTPPASMRRRTTGANTNAPAARALVTRPVLRPSPKGGRSEICTLRPYPTPAEAPKRRAYPANRGATETCGRAREAMSMPSPPKSAAPDAMTAGLRREYRKGPIFATATVNATVASEKTTESTARPTPRARSRGTR
jgi:hypothetical protein